MRIDPDYLAGVAPFGTPDYYALLFSPATEREDIRMLLALEHHLSRISSLSPEPQVRQAKLGWWAGELDRLSEGKPVHPVATAVQEVLERRQLSPSPVLELFTAIVREVNDDWPDTPEALLSHGQRRGAIMRLIADTLGKAEHRSTDDTEPFRTLGSARFVALCLGYEHHCPQAPFQLADPAAQDHGPLIASLAATQRQQLDKVLHTLPAGQRPRYVPLLVMAALVQLHLGIMADEDEQRGPSRMSALLHAWRAARAASRGKLPG